MRKNRKITIEEAIKQGFIPIEFLEEVEDVGVFVIDKNEKIICYSKGCEKIDGYTKEEVIGLHPRDIYKVIHPLLSEERLDASLTLASMREGRTYIDLYDCYQTQQKEEIDISNSSYPIRDEQGEVIGALTVYREVSDYLNMVSVRNNEKADAKNHYIKKNKNGLQYDFSDIIGQSIAMQKCITQGKIASETNAPVLIFGETGTGKEVFAQSIHNKDSRKERPFVAINCSAIPVNLLESTLFGTTKSAFTGAADTNGLFAEAEGGTLFLDELNSMDIALQSKLLRVIETKHYRKVGGTKEIKSNIRIISALNQEPFEAIENNQLRRDLYYRLAIFVIHLPPLRERKEDLLLLSESFIENISGALGKKVTKLSRDTYNIFKRHQWDGNIRELKHVITQSLYMAGNSELFLKAEYLPQYLLNVGKTPAQNSLPREFGAALGLKESLDLIEQQLIENALRKNGENVSKTARD
ncbi:MAG: sigma 54-interacting transcriptional regulator, partial [Eubacterium sp.]